MQQQPAAAQQLTVIPYPADVEFVGPGTYTLPKPPAISSSAALAPQAEFLQQGLQQRFSTPSNLQQQPEGSAQASQASIRLELVDDLPALWPYRFSNEGYELVCAEDGISIRALSTTGVFYGIQTLLQALAEGQQGLSMPHTRVVDAPRFLWRGVLLDVGRHFFPVPFILRLLDLMALYKANRFHWHLTEDQGWRLEVPSLPRLAEVAAWRGKLPAAAAAEGAGSSSDSDGQPPPAQQQQQQEQQQQQQEAEGGSPMCASPSGSSEGDKQQQQQQGGASSVLGRPPPSAATYHGGYYTQADVAQIVSYAAARCIEVVPEIELPGHCVAALAAYPHLSCTGEVSAVSTHWGIHEDVYCAGNEAAFTFLETVLDQVITQFPCPYIHIGGDEVPKVRWEECPKCQAVMEAEGLSSEAELQSWFVRRISDYLAAKGRKLIGWDEILEGGLAEGATVMSWRGNIGGIIAAKSGHDVIMTPTSHCYFDYRQAPSAAEPGAWYACLPLHVVYIYDPIPGPWQEPGAAAEEELGAGQQQQAGGGADADMASPPDSAAQGADGRDSPSTAGMMEDTASGGGAQPAQQQPSSQAAAPSPELPTPAVGAAVVDPSAAAAAGPHYPGHPPGASLAPLVATASSAAADAAAAAGSSDCSGSSGRPARLGVLSEAEAAHILGSQANLWTEYVADEATAEYMLLPRLAALAEAVWTPVEVKDWGGFTGRLQHHLPLLDRLGYLYRPLGP